MSPQEHGLRIKEGISRARDRGTTIGRPRKFSVERARELNTSGLTHREIARVLRCTHADVAAALGRVTP